MSEISIARKKIIIIGPTESILTKRGNRHPALAQFLVDQGHELQYLTSDFYHAEKRWFSPDEITHAKKAAPYGLVVFNCLGYRANISLRRVVSNFLFSLKVFSYLLPRVTKQNLIILPSRPVEMIFAMALLKIVRKASVTLDIQDIWPDMLVIDNRYKKGLFWCYCSIYLYPSLRFIDKFFHVAPSFVNWLHRYAPDAKSTFIPLGFDNERWDRFPEIRRENDQKNIYLVCISQLTFQFDIMPLVKAINDFETVHLIIIGEDGTGERYPEVKEYISRFGLKNVEMAGVVERNILGNYLNKTDIGIVPMVSTSIPNKVFDYIAACVPLLVLGENDSSEFVREYDIGWNVQFDESQISNFLKTIKRKEIEEKRSNIKKIRSLFSRKILHKRIEEVLLSQV